MGPLGIGPPRHEWREQPLVALLGSVGHNLRRSDASGNITSGSQLKRKVEKKFGVVWERKFGEPVLGSKTESLLSILGGARWLDSRWDRVCMLFFDWSLCQLQCDYHVNGEVLVHAVPHAERSSYAGPPQVRQRALGDKLLLCGRTAGSAGGEGAGVHNEKKIFERLPPGMRFAGRWPSFAWSFSDGSKYSERTRRNTSGTLAFVFERESPEEAEVSVNICTYLVPGT